LFVWFYNRTGSSVLLVAIFHASIDAAINQLYDDVVPGSATVSFIIFNSGRELVRRTLRPLSGQSLHRTCAQAGPRQQVVQQAVS
jgi:hypothetical protein